jgi:hypothetical protein
LLARYLQNCQRALHYRRHLHLVVVVSTRVHLEVVFASPLPTDAPHIEWVL